MSQTSNLKSPAITSLDATPPVRTTAGQGGAGKLQSIYGTCQPLTADLAGSTYRFVRVPSNCSIQRISLDFAGGGTITHLMTSGTLYYSDEALDQTGESAENSGVLTAVAGSGQTGLLGGPAAGALSTTNSLFWSAVDLATDSTAGTFYDLTNQNDLYGPNSRTVPLWQAAGLSSDPGGNFDITAVVVTDTSSFTSAIVVGLKVDFINPYV